MCQPEPESVTAAKLPIGSGEVAEQGHVVIIHEVSAHAVMYRYFIEIMDSFRCQVMSRPQV